MTQISTADALALFAQIFEEPADRIALSTERADVPGWDSMGALSLMAELDERFGIELTADMSRSITRISGLLDLLRKSGALLD